jgi:general stress protein 26
MGQAQEKNSTEQAQKNFFELLAKFDNAMLVTQTGTGGAPHARPMAIAETSEDGSIWFITGADTPKIDELERNSNVVAIMQNARQWLTVSGHAELHRDRARIHKVWKEAFRAWFDGKDDPNIVLIRVNPNEAEYWDNTGKNAIKFALTFAAAYLGGRRGGESGGRKTGEPEDVDTHAKVQL